MLRGELMTKSLRGRKFLGDNVQGGQEIMVFRGEEMPGGRRFQVGEGSRWEKVCKPFHSASQKILAGKEEV